MREERFSHAALVLAAHGSHLNANSAAPCYAAADVIRQKRLFAEVQEAFWKEEPAFRQVLHMVESDEVFVVPFFISDGYFTETVLPREFGVTPPRSIVHEKTVHYCQPVGTHDSMTRVILHRAAVAANVDGPTGLVIAGHGTNRNENSGRSIVRQVGLIRALCRFAEVHAAFLDQEPRLERCYEMTRSPNLVVVPFFISDGLHSQEDIPRLLHLGERPADDTAPSRVNDRNVWYTAAVGADPTMADVVIERAAQAAGM